MFTVSSIFNCVKCAQGQMFVSNTNIFRLLPVLFKIIRAIMCVSIYQRVFKSIRLA